MKTLDLASWRRSGISDLRPRVTPNELMFFKDLRTRLDRLKPGTRMLLDINSARYLTEFIGTPLYRGRNATYVSFEPYQIEKWLAQADQIIVNAVVSKFDRS
jgi:hypothetical protein